MELFSGMCFEGNGGGTAESLFDREDVHACLFDLDGVLTPTADIHRKAWSELFEQAFTLAPDVPPYSDNDYYTLVDGRPRYDGVRAVLASRGISIPEGDPSDPGSLETICAMGNLKDSLFLERVSRCGVEAYPGSLLFLSTATAAGWKLGVVSASQNARTILEAAGIIDCFETIVDGHLTADMGLSGKPAPDTYLEGAHRLGVNPLCTVVVEDALGGVEAGRAGGFACVIGVNRGAGAEALIAHGATIVVDDLAQLVPDPSGSPQPSSPQVIQTTSGSPQPCDPSTSFKEES